MPQFSPCLLSRFLIDMNPSVYTMAKYVFITQHSTLMKIQWSSSYRNYIFYSTQILCLQVDTVNLP